MDSLPRIGIDWNNRYGDGYVLYLPCSTDDMKKQGIVLKEGLHVRIYGDAYEADAIITWYDNKFWLAKQIQGTFVERGE